jgi:hypothetical protein
LFRSLSRTKAGVIDNLSMAIADAIELIPPGGLRHGTEVAVDGWGESSGRQTSAGSRGQASTRVRVMAARGWRIS